MGAGSITSNVKSDKKLVVVKTPEGNCETGMKKFGAMQMCIRDRRNTIGAPGPEAMKKVIALHEAYLEEC